MVRRTRPTPGSQLALITEYSYHAFMTDRDGDPVELDAWHRAHANCENAIRDLKYGVGLNHLPSGRFGANVAWLTLNVIAHNLSRWTARIGGIDTDDPTATAENAPERQDHRQAFLTTDTLRRRYLAIPGRLATRSPRSTSICPPAGHGPCSSTPCSTPSARSNSSSDPPAGPTPVAAAFDHKPLPTQTPNPRAPSTASTAARPPSAVTAHPKLIQRLTGDRPIPIGGSGLSYRDDVSGRPLEAGTAG